MIGKRAVRLTLWTLAAALVLYALAADPTEVGLGRETYFRATFRQLIDSDEVAVNLAYFVNEYTLAAAGLALVSLAFREPRKSGA